MKIICGLKNGALLQRDENNVCKCFFKAETNGEMKSSIGKVLKNDDGRYVLTGIPVGGPYSFTLSDQKDVIEFNDIYVGDLWFLGGQSNMEGAGKMREKNWKYDENPVQEIRAYYMNDSWGAAKSQLHQLWDCPDECVSGFYRKYHKESPWGREYPEVQKDGIGPGLFFALEMYKRKGVPQGVIPCGIGGASLAQWDPDGTDNYYASALRRFHECGGVVKGVFWYQGCAQCSDDGVASFEKDMEKLVAGMRRDYGDENLPFVQVQLNKCLIDFGCGEAIDRCYSAIREKQRTLGKKIKNLVTVSAVDCELEDLIHISSESHEKVGARAAEAMCVLLGEEGVPYPELDYIEIVEDDFVPFRVNLIVHYKNIVGELQSKDYPWGFYIHKEADKPHVRGISRLYVHGNSVRVKLETPPEELPEWYISYAYGNTYYCNITDSAGRAIPAFGPLKIKDCLRK